MPFQDYWDSRGATSICLTDYTDYADFHGFQQETLSRFEVA